MKGGYQIIDLKGNSLSSSALTLEGIYDAVEGADAPILLEGINIGGTELKPQFVNFVGSSGGTFLGHIITSVSATTLTLYQISIASDDKVTAATVTISIA